MMVKRIGALVLALAVAHAWATPPAGSPYATDLQNQYVQDATSDGIDHVNMVLCIMNSLRPADMVNAGTYVALVDKNKCDTTQRANASNSASGASGASAAPDYMNAVVQVTRASNTDPMLGKVWMSMTQNGHAVDIYVSINATQSPADVPPYGVFRLDYIGKAGGALMFNGYIDSSSGLLKFLETGPQGSGAALALTASSTTSGAGTMTAGNPTPGTFNFAYNPSYFRRSDGSHDQCFDRQKANANRSVWRYGTYNASDGTRVDVAHPGFPVQATTSGNSYYGYASYYGVNFQGLDLNGLPDSTAVAGVAISDQRPGNSTAYTLGKVSGKLTRWDRNQTTLAAMDGIPFNFGGDLTNKTSSQSLSGFGNWQVVWNNASGSFSVVGKQACGMGGCVVTAITPAATINANALNNAPIMGWSDSFGGNLNIPFTGAPHAGTDPVFYYTQSLVIPGSSALNLNCLSQCPTSGSVGAANTYQSGNPPSPFGANTGQQWFSAQSASNTVSYTFDAGGLENGTTGMVVSNAAYFSANPMYANGIMTGRMFTDALSHANCPAAMPAGNVCEPANPTTYYTWQTGPNPWDQSLWLTNKSTSAVLQFDAPQNIAYTVKAADDASGAWAGKNIQLQFNGFGNLFGIPGSCVNPVDNSPVDCSVAGARYVPAFALADGDTMSMGSTPLIVKGLDEELRLASVPLSSCTGANLTLNPQTVPTGGTTDPSATLGAKPTPTVNSGAPKVIDGVIQ